MVGPEQILLLSTGLTLFHVKVRQYFESHQELLSSLEDTCRTGKQGGQLNPERVNICYGQEHHHKGRALLIQWLPASKDGPTPFPCKVNKRSS